MASVLTTAAVEQILACGRGDMRDLTQRLGFDDRRHSNHVQVEIQGWVYAPRRRSYPPGVSEP